MNQVHFDLSVATLEKFLFDIIVQFGKTSQGAVQNIAPVLIRASIGEDGEPIKIHMVVFRI